MIDRIILKITLSGPYVIHFLELTNIISNRLLLQQVKVKELCKIVKSQKELLSEHEIFKVYSVKWKPYKRRAYKSAGKMYLMKVLFLIVTAFYPCYNVLSSEECACRKKFQQ